MLIVADNLNILRPEISRALEERDPEPIQRWVRRCVTAGARAIDINSGPLPRHPGRRFAFLVEAVQDVTDLPLLLDTTNPAALAAGLSVCRNPVTINGFSLEPAKLQHILPLAAAWDADVIGYLLDAKSRAPIDLDEMMTTAVSLFTAFSRIGIDPSRLIIDPVITPISWENGIRHNRAVLTFMRKLPELLGVPVRTIAGLSNLASGPISAWKKTILENAFLPMLADAGLSMVLINVSRERSIQVAKACNALVDDAVFSWAELDGGKG
jgi:5-methyltetrahydrofolate corrinoid/iron sulfur protein methyltransferase